ncbi:MAG: hypothetical protein ACNYPI_08635 [Arenicellales bacterium WSBS_2016_MAG_OTU3]
MVSVGGHGYVQPNTIVGMMQLDLADDDALNITGKGWLSGPYFVHKLTETVITVQKVATLWPNRKTEISPSNTYTDSFDSDRYLAQFRITGLSWLPNGNHNARYRLHLHRRHGRHHRQPPPPDRRTKRRLTQMTFGLDFKLPIAMQTETLDFTGGLSGIIRSVGGNGGKSESDIKGGRGRMELGLNYRRSENGNGNRVTLIATTFYDGISSDYESYGVNFSVGMEF